MDEDGVKIDYIDPNSQAFVNHSFEEGYLTASQISRQSPNKNKTPAVTVFMPPREGDEEVDVGQLSSPRRSVPSVRFEPDEGGYVRRPPIPEVEGEDIDAAIPPHTAPEPPPVTRSKTAPHGPHGR